MCQETETHRFIGDGGVFSASREEDILICWRPNFGVSTLVTVHSVPDFLSFEICGDSQGSPGCSLVLFAFCLPLYVWATTSFNACSTSYDISVLNAACFSWSDTPALIVDKCRVSGCQSSELVFTASIITEVFGPFHCSCWGQFLHVTQVAWRGTTMADYNQTVGGKFKITWLHAGINDLFPDFSAIFIELDHGWLCSCNDKNVVWGVNS